MIKLTEKTKIYVHCPSGVVTGGAELLHQLVSILNDNGKNAFIVYYGGKPHEVPSDYKDYNIKIAPAVEDDEHNVEVIYEGRFDFIRKNKYVQKILWWLSVDNFFYCSTTFLSFGDMISFSKRLALRSIARRLINSITKGRVDNLFHPLTIRELRDENCINCYQSEYAQNFLCNHGFKETLPLKDFINKEHDFDKVDLSKKENIVLYNPKKGFEFTKQLIVAAPEIKWIPLQGMSRVQLIDIIKKAKVYIDFGFHPGKDRLPRECAMNGCCVITGYRGSAGFFEDVMLTREYKFKDSLKEIPAIVEKIKWIFDNYTDAVNDFAMYRQAISEEGKEFETQVAKLFGYYSLQTVLS